MGSSLILSNASQVFEGRNLLNMRITIVSGEPDLAVTQQMATLFRSVNLNVWTKEELLPGQDWDLAVAKAFDAAHFILVLLSAETVATVSGFQRRIKQALEANSTMPSGGIKVIPCRLNECELPYSLRHLWCVDMYTGREAWIRLLKGFAAEWQRRTQANDWK